jgi:hypothetical protein
MEPSYKGQQLIVLNFPASGNSRISINSLYPIDKIRVTCFDSLTMTGFTPVISVWTDLVNNYVGTIGTDYAGGAYEFSSPMKPQDGIEFWYPNRMILNGEYNVQFRTLANAIPAGVGNEAFILIEYFQYEL